jgi:translocation and assembly module TamB
MSPTDAKPAPRRFKWVQALLGFLLLGAVVGLAVYLNSDSFREKVRIRVAAELERMTGGRAEIASFTWNLSRLHFEAKGLTIHGLEGRGEESYVHAGRVSVRLKIISLLSRKIALREVIIDDLAVHLIVQPDGSTNQPSPQGGTEDSLSAKRLFDLDVGRIEINRGTLLLNQERMPFALAGDRFTASLSYSKEEHGYEGSVAASVASASWRDLKPVSGDIDLRFLMRANETEIKSLKVSAGRSTLEAHGVVRGYSHPELQFKYAASLDLPEVARQTALAAIRAGHAAVQGSLAYQGQRYSAPGTITIRGLDWVDSALPLRAYGIDGTCDFNLSPEKIALPRLALRIFGGSVTGDAQIANWRSAASSPPAAPASRAQRKNSAVAAQPETMRGLANLHLARLQIGTLARAVSTSRLPLEKLELAGGAAGDVKISWTGPIKNAVAEMVVDVDPPSNPLPRELPVTAHMLATYHGDTRTMRIASLTLATRAIHANANGELGSRTTQAHLAVNATDLHELQPVLDAFRPGTRIPVTVNGHASFSGYVFGDFDALGARGHLELENFSSEIAFAARPSPEPPGGAGAAPSIHWDSMVADLNYSPSGVTLQHGTLRRAKTTIAFSGSTSLHQGAFDQSTSQIVLDLRLENAGLSEIQELAGTNYPVTGTLTADLRASGTAQNLRGSGNLQVTGLTAYGESFRSLHGQIQLAGREVLLNNISLSHNGAQLAGSAGYDLGNKHFHFDVTGSNVQLATLRQLQTPRFAFEGKAGFHLTGSGSADSPLINGQLNIANLTVNREVLGGLNVTAETRGQEMQIHGKAVFEDANLNLEGKVQLRGDFPAQMTLNFDHLDFNALLRAYMQDQVTGHSAVAGSVGIHGLVKRPREISVDGAVQQLSVNIENVILKNDGPVHVSIEHGLLRADQFHLTGQNTEFFLHGGMQLFDDQRMDLHARGRLDLKMAQGFNPNILAYGPASFIVDVEGTPAHPQTKGRIELKDAGVSLVDLPNGLSHINGTMVFAQDRVQIEKLTANSGGGELNLGGFLAYRGGLYFDLTATGKDVRLRYPPGVSTSADANLHYTGSSKSSLLSGDITITRFGMNPRFDFGTFLTQTKSPTGVNTLNPFLDNLRLDVHIVSTPELRVETTLAKLSGDLDLRVRGTAARPALLGRVNIAEGDVFFNGTKYRLERGDITFSNPLVIEPVINIEMSARVQNYDITIGLHGSLSGGSSLRVTYRSDPPLSSTDIISLLAFGRPRQQDVYTAGQPGQTASGQTASDTSNAILGQALDTAVSSRVERLFGAGGRVKIDPQFIGQQNNSVARVTVEQQINNNITLTYVTNLTQSSQTVVQVEYNVDKNVSIVAVRDQYGVLGFDVHIRRHKK